MLTKSNATVHTEHYVVPGVETRQPGLTVDLVLLQNNNRSYTSGYSNSVVCPHCISPHPEDSTERVISSISSQPRHFSPSLLFPHLVTCLSSFLFPVAVCPHIPVLVYHQCYPSISTCY